MALPGGSPFPIHFRLVWRNVPLLCQVFIGNNPISGKGSFSTPIPFPPRDLYTETAPCPTNQYDSSESAFCVIRLCDKKHTVSGQLARKQPVTAVRKNDFNFWLSQTWE
jgi:hypothetical protein